MAIDESVSKEKYRGTDPSDFYLELLLGFVENGSEIPITLNVRGLIVSGIMISEKKYFSSFAGGAVKERIDELKASGKLQFLDDETDEEEEMHLYIHLKNAKFFGVGPHGVIPGGGDGLLWRGRISSIDGYSEHRLGFADEELVKASGAR